MILPVFSSDRTENDTVPSGYTRFEVNGAVAVACEWAAVSVAAALCTGTLHEWATGQKSKQVMRGRGVIYAVSLPSAPATTVVVRRNRHGGLLHALTGDYFLAPTRAPLELATSLRLAAAGIPTPEVIAYALYPTLGFFARSDVMTRRLPAGDDLPAAWRKGDKKSRNAMLKAVGRLLTALAGAGAWHADLNLKNIYIAGNNTDMKAYLLDVDRVTFPGGSDSAVRNFSRLTRSARKWREKWGLDFDEDALARLAFLAEIKE